MSSGVVKTNSDTDNRITVHSFTYIKSGRSLNKRPCAGDRNTRPLSSRGMSKFLVESIFVFGCHHDRMKQLLTLFHGLDAICEIIHSIQISSKYGKRYDRHNNNYSHGGALIHSLRSPRPRQFPLLALVAVLATGGLEAENNLHNLLASAWWVNPAADAGDANWRQWIQKWKTDTVRRYINDLRRQNWLLAFRCAC